MSKLGTMLSRLRSSDDDFEARIHEAADDLRAAESEPVEPSPLMGASVARIKSAHEQGLRGMLAKRNVIVDEIERLQDQLAQTVLCIEVAEESIKRLSSYTTKQRPPRVVDTVQSRPDLVAAHPIEGASRSKERA